MINAVIQCTVQSAFRTIAVAGRGDRKCALSICDLDFPQSDDSLLNLLVSTIECVSG